MKRVYFVLSLTYMLLALAQPFGACHAQVVENQSEASVAPDRLERVQQSLNSLAAAKLWLERQQQVDANARQRLEAYQQEWQAVLKEFNYALEDEQLYPGSQNFKRYRLQLQERLRETNQRVINAERFLNEWLGPVFELRHEVELLNMQVRDTDSQAIAAAIEQWRIEFKVIDIKLSKFYQARAPALY